jgi:hypothetical protein
MMFLFGRFTKIYPKFQITRKFLTIINNLNCISHFVGSQAPISHIWVEFLTFGHFSSEFLTFGSNFPLFTTFPANFSLFEQISHFSSRPTPTPASPIALPAGPSHTGSPNDMVTSMLLACSYRLALPGRSPFDMPACKK